MDATTHASEELSKAPPDTLSSEERHLLDAVAEALLLCNADGEPVYWNKAFGEFPDEGMEGDALESAGYAERMLMMTAVPMLQEACAEALNRASGQNPVVRFEETLGGRLYEVNCRRWRRADNKADGIVSTFRDVHSRQTMSERLQTAHDEILQLKYHISHDLGAPLAAARGLLGLMADDLAAGTIDELPEMLEETATQLVRLETLSEDLMSLARAGAEPLEPVEVELRSLVDEIVDSVSLHTRELEVSVSLTSDAPTILTDRTRLRQVLANLISNARKFRDPAELAPFIHVNVRDEGLHWRIAVSDNGIGMSEQTASKAFDTFTRGSERYPGHGLGLHIVLKHVDQLGGEVCVATIGKPTTIDVTLPKL